MTEVKRLQFSEGIETIKPEDLVPNSPDGLETLSVTDSHSPLTLIVNRRYFSNTTSGVIAATTPAGPSTGDRIQIIDNGNAFDTNNFTVTAASGTINGAASDTLKSEGEVVEYVYDAANTNWAKLAFGSGGGLSNDGVQRIALFTADANREYFVKTDAGAFQIELPVLAAGAAVRFVDSTGFWSTNSPTLVNNGTAGFNGGDPLELDVGGSWIEFTANMDDNEWETKGPNAAEGSQAATDSVAGVTKKNRIQQLEVTSASAGNDIAGLRFTNLIVGRVYKATAGHQTSAWGSGSEQIQVVIRHDGNIVTRIRYDQNLGNTPDNIYDLKPGVFVATTTTMTTDLTATNVTADIINVTLEELNNYELTSDLS